ncbi:MAG: GNAT family N-acetyltransferase [Ferruginibacter sp.]
MNYILQTERLVLRKFTLHDTKFIIELLNSPGWIQYIGDRNIKTQEDANIYLQNGPLKSYELNGYGLAMVQLKHGTPIGMCGIIKRDNLENPDIGFALLPQYTGKGFAFEIACATLAYARNELNLTSIFAITSPGNRRSIQLLERLGFKFIREMVFPGNKQLLHLYEV